MSSISKRRQHIGPEPSSFFPDEFNIFRRSLLRSWAFLILSNQELSWPHFPFVCFAGTKKRSEAIVLVHESSSTQHMAVHSCGVHFGVFDTSHGGSSQSLRMAESPHLHVDQQLRRQSFFNGQLLLVHGGKLDATGIRPQSQGEWLPEKLFFFLCNSANFKTYSCITLFPCGIMYIFIVEISLVGCFRLLFSEMPTFPTPILPPEEYVIN